MPKRIVYTKITPLPSNVPRQLALDMLHSHGEIIALNPLVTGHKEIPAPRDAARDEYFAQWYEIEEIITWGFGMKKKIAFKGCFHDMPWGLQTHIYAPMGVDLRNKYQIAGNQPGEPREVRELGVDAPAEGLYLKEDVEITCNVALSSFVKKETKQTLETMIERMTKKAEMLDDGVLMAMFENGRLKTVNPNQLNKRDRLSMTSTDISPNSPGGSGSPPPSQQEFSPSHTFTKYSSLPGRTHTRNGSRGGQQYGPVEMEGSSQYITTPDSATRPYPAVNAHQTFTAELADTSINTTYTHANLSFSPTSAGLKPASVHSRLSYEQEERLNAQVRPGAYDTPDDVGKKSMASAGYAIANPDQPQAPNQSAQDAYARAGLAQQLNGLHLSSGSQSGGQQPTPPAKITQCPMDKCDVEGTPDVISQHVNRHHFV